MKAQKDPKELYNERLKRIMDAINLKEPDRVPVVPYIETFAAAYAGISVAECFLKPEKAFAALEKTILELDFDSDNLAASPMPLLGQAFAVKTIGPRYYKVPGFDVSSTALFQWVQKDWVAEDFYDEFLERPVDFLLRRLLPELNELFEPFRRLPPLEITLLDPYPFFFMVLPLLGEGEILDSIIKLLVVAREQRKYRDLAANYVQRMEGQGYPLIRGLGLFSPFDLISDFIRGPKAFIDCYRIPDKVIPVLDKLRKWNLELAVTVTRTMKPPMVFIPLHAGPFLSRKHFDKIYWPPLKRLVLDLADHGIITHILFEADWTPYLEYLKELPKGRVIAWFEKADIFKAKDIIGDRVCIKGNVPPSLLCTGTPSQVEEYCKKLIERCGEGGGYILDAGSLLEYGMKPENVKAMVEAAKKYGVYRK